jgi:hypothetical protein
MSNEAVPASAYKVRIIFFSLSYYRLRWRQFKIKRTGFPSLVYSSYKRRCIICKICGQKNQFCVISKLNNKLYNKFNYYKI